MRMSDITMSVLMEMLYPGCFRMMKILLLGSIGLRYAFSGYM